MKGPLITQRMIEIIDLILHSQTKVNNTALASLLEVSKRTITRELVGVKSVLENFNLSMETDAGDGYTVVGKTVDKYALQDYVKSSSSKVLEFKKEERVKRLIAELLKKYKIDKLSYFSYVFDVSDGTISRDLKLVEAWFEPYEISLKKRNTGGFILNGAEESIRKAKVDFLHAHLYKGQQEYKNFNRDTINEYFDTKDDSILSLLDKSTIFKIIEVLDYDDVFIIKEMSKETFTGFVIHLTIAVERIRRNQVIAVSRDVMKTLHLDPLSREVRLLIQRLSNALDVAFPKEEVAYILIYLKGTRIRAREGVQENLEYYVETEDCMIVVKHILNALEILTLETFRDDEELISGLVTHLLPALNRLRHKTYARNPLIDKIKENYANVFDITNSVTSYIESIYDLEFNEDEVGFLALHIGAAFERKKTEVVTRGLSIAVVCPSGFGASTLLISSLQSKYPEIENLTASSIHTFQDLLKQSTYDGIISTYTLPKQRIPHITVDSILSQVDFEQIDLFMKQLISSRGNRIESMIRQSEVKYNKNVLKEMDLVEFEDEKDLQELLTDLLDTSRFDEQEKLKSIESILERERQGQVILSEHDFIMFHATVDAIKKPFVRFFRFEKKIQLHDGANIKYGVLMLLPGCALECDKATLSLISYALIERTDFYNCIKYETIDDIINFLIVYGNERRVY